MNLALDKDFGAVRHLAEIMACRYGTNLDETLSKLTDVFFAHDGTIIFENDLTEKKELQDSSESSALSHRSSLTSFPPSSWDDYKMQASDTRKTHAVTPTIPPSTRMASNQQRLYRPFSFYIGDDRDVDIFSRPRPDMPDSFFSKSNLPSLPGLNSTAQTLAPLVRNLVEANEIQVSPSRSRPPLPIHTSSCSLIATSSSIMNGGDTMRRTRENSYSSIATVVRHSSANFEAEGSNKPSSEVRTDTISRLPSEAKSNSTSRPDSVRTSSLQSIMCGLRGNRYMASGAPSLGFSSINSGQRRSQAAIAEEYGLTEDGKAAAIAAARAAGERGSQG